jgi:hypothetical protein
MKKNKQTKIFLPEVFKWGHEIKSSWASVFITSDDEILNKEDYKIFFNNLQNHQATLTAVVGGMKFLEIYSMYSFSKLYLFDININEFSKMEIFFKYILNTQYKDYEGQNFLEKNINASFNDFYLPMSLSHAKIIRPEKFKLNDIGKEDSEINLDMIFRASVYPEYKWQPSEKEYKQVIENLKYSWPEYHFELPNLKKNKTISVIYDSHIPWKPINDIYPYQSKSITKLIFHFLTGGFFDLDTIKFIILPYYNKKKYLFKRTFSFKSILRILSFSLIANRVWNAEQLFFLKRFNNDNIIIHETRHVFGLEKNLFNLFKKRTLLEPHKLWDKTLLSIIKDNKNGIQVWSTKNKKLINNQERNYFVNKSCSIMDFSQYKEIIHKCDYIIFHNILSYGNNLKDLGQWVDLCKLENIKIIISENIIDIKEVEMDITVKNVVKKEIKYILYSGGNNQKIRNKFYIF